MADRIVLVAAEGERFEVPRKVAQMSDLVKSMTEDGNGESEEIPLQDIKANILSRVIDFMTHHADVKLPEIEKPLKSKNLADIVPEWDARFVDVDQEILFELVLAANYLDLKSLLDLTCAKVASMVKDKSPEEIRKTFSIRNDFTPEEELQAIEENKWVSEG